MNLLTIGGSDPTSGAGIQGDIMTFNALQVYPLSVITAITSQNTKEVSMVYPISSVILNRQLQSIMSDIQIDGIKISMVYTSPIIKTLRKNLENLDVPIVLDPVINSTTGGELIKKSAIPDYRKYLIPTATVITPNKFEAEILSNTRIKSELSLQKAAKKIQDLGAKTVVITGIEKNKKIIDYVFEPEKNYQIVGQKIISKNHGSGCTFSSALLVSLVNGKSLKESVRYAKKITSQSIKDAKNIGKGIEIVQINPRDRIKNELSSAIESLKSLPKFFERIPECQTNFVFSKPLPRSTKDVVGVSGRIVRTGNNVIQAGELIYGGSKHVATALITINRKFPEIRSAINIKYEKKIVTKLRNRKFKVLSYDRKKEPNHIKKSGSSINWGINFAIKESSEAPDAVYHLGDMGKEPMILIFGKNPKSILEKLTRI